MVDKTTGVLDPTFNPAPDGAVRTFAFSPNGSRIYVGGDYANIAGTAQAYLVALDPVTGACIPVVFQQFQGTGPRPRRRPRRYPRVRRLSVAPRATATAPSRGNANTGARLWRNESDGDVQAIEYTNGEIYFGFHEGYNGNPLRHLLAADAATGVTDPNFQPDLNSFWGVWSIDESGGTIAVGGEFTTFDGVAVQGIVLLLSLFAGDHTPPNDTDVTSRRPGTRHRLSTLAWGLLRRTTSQLSGLPDLPRRYAGRLQHDALLHGQRPQPVDRRTATRCERSTRNNNVSRPHAARDGHDVTAACGRGCELAVSRQRARSRHRVPCSVFDDTVLGDKATPNSATATAMKSRRSDSVRTPNTKYVTTYFRRTFNVSNPASITSP